MAERINGQHLPTVTRETYDAFMHNAVEQGKPHYAEQAAQKFDDEQIILSEDVRRYIDKAAQSKPEHARMTALALRMYKMLSMQAEAEAFDSQFGQLLD